jgi:opacity protein-like surface antigen
MKKSILSNACVFALSLAAASAPVYSMSSGTATAPEHTKMALGADLVGQLPVGDFADVVGFGLGALLRYEYQIQESALGLTARAGYIHHMSKDGGLESYAQIPILAGVKYSLTGAPIYVGAELGAVMSMSKADFPGAESESETNLGLGAGAGYELGPVDIRLGLNFADASNLAETMAIGVSFGYNFWGM